MLRHTKERHNAAVPRADQANRAILDRSAAAIENVDVAVLVELLHEDATATN
jgi:hypothetical protein